jgi:hypothetical protein
MSELRRSPCSGYADFLGRGFQVFALRLPLRFTPDSSYKSHRLQGGGALTDWSPAGTGFSCDQFTELIEAGSIDRENGRDHEPAIVGDLITMGGGNFLNESVGAQ